MSSMSWSGFNNIISHPRVFPMIPACCRGEYSQNKPCVDCINRSRMSGAPSRPWTGEDDQQLITHVQQYGERAWSKTGRILKRSASNCRNRWNQCLRPKLIQQQQEAEAQARRTGRLSLNRTSILQRKRKSDPPLNLSQITNRLNPPKRIIKNNLCVKTNLSSSSLTNNAQCSSATIDSSVFTSTFNNDALVNSPCENTSPNSFYYDPPVVGVSNATLASGGSCSISGPSFLSSTEDGFSSSLKDDQYYEDFEDIYPLDELPSNDLLLKDVVNMGHSSAQPVIEFDHENNLALYDDDASANDFPWQDDSVHDEPFYNGNYFYDGPQMS